MDIEEKSLRRLVEEGKGMTPELRVMDSGMNVSLSVAVEDGNNYVLHTRRGGVRVMSPQAALRFTRELFGVDEIKVVLKNARK